MQRTTSTSNRLPILAAAIREDHAAIQRSAIDMASRALAAGAALTEAKATLPHGQWENWLKANTGLSARTARRYMQMAQSGLKPDTVAELRIRAAIASISCRAAVISAAEGYDAWLTELLDTLDKAEADCPGFRAGFRAWVKSQRASERYVKTLRANCPDGELPELNAMIEAEQHRTLHLSIRRAKTMGRAMP